MGILRYNKLIKESVEELEQLLKKEREMLGFIKEYKLFIN